MLHVIYYFQRVQQVLFHTVRVHFIIIVFYSQSPLFYHTDLYMPKPKLSKHKSPKINQLPQSKPSSSKNKNINLFKSIEKTQQNNDPQYLFKLSFPKQSKQKAHPKNDNIVAKLEKPQWKKKSTHQSTNDYYKKINSDQQSTHANGLFQSGEIFQNLIHKTKQKLTQSIKMQQQQPKQKHIKHSDPNSLRSSLKNTLTQFNLLKKRHQQQVEQYGSKSTAEEVRRLCKIQAIERQVFQQQMRGLEARKKLKSETKIVNSKVSIKRV